MTSSPTLRLSPATRLAVAAVLVITAVSRCWTLRTWWTWWRNVGVAAAGMLMALEGLHQLRDRRAGISVLR
jgi:hypothetical protein